MNDEPLSPKGRLAALEALVESPGWALFTKEVAARQARHTIEACDLDRKKAKRAGSAGAANELAALLGYVPAAINSLEKRLEDDRKKAAAQKRPVSG